jgi:microcystin-dependent protein
LGGSRLNVDNNAPALALNYLCNTEGIFPARGAPDNTDPVEPFIGEVFLYAGAMLDRQPTCGGQLLSIFQNQALFSVLGTTFGGDGRTTFGLPNLRNRTAVGTGTGPGLDPVGYGSEYGLASLALWASPSVWPDSTVPAAPTGVAAVAGNGQASVSWTAPDSNGGSPITGYVITPYLGTVALTPRRYDTVALTQVVSDLERGKSYTFKVAATNANGTGLDSLPSNAVAPK